MKINHLKTQINRLKPKTLTGTGFKFKNKTKILFPQKKLNR